MKYPSAGGTWRHDADGNLVAATEALSVEPEAVQAPAPPDPEPDPIIQAEALPDPVPDPDPVTDEPETGAPDSEEA